MFNRHEQFSKKIKGWQDFVEFCIRTTGKDICRENFTEVMTAVEVYCQEQELMFKMTFDHLDSMWTVVLMKESGAHGGFFSDKEPLTAMVKAVLTSARDLNAKEKLR